MQDRTTPSETGARTFPRPAYIIKYRARGDTLSRSECLLTHRNSIGTSVSGVFRVVPTAKTHG